MRRYCSFLIIWKKKHYLILVKKNLSKYHRIEWARVRIKSCLLSLTGQRYRLFLCWLIVYFRISQRYSLDCVFNMFNCVLLHFNFLWYLHVDIIEKLKFDVFQWCNNRVNRRSIMCTMQTIKAFTFAKLSKSQIWICRRHFLFLCWLIDLQNAFVLQYIQRKYNFYNILFKYRFIRIKHDCRQLISFNSYNSERLKII